LPALIEEEDPALRRAREVERIQQSIIRRRQKKLALLGVRLAFFVGLPTLLAGWYFYTVASPMYSTKSAFLIQQNSEQSSGGGGGLMGMISGGGGGGLSDGSSVQSYLTSIEAMIRLDQDHNFIAHYSDPAIDPLARLNADASNEEAFKVFKKSVKIGYDPTEGLVNMEVIAASPDASVEFSNALINYAEERVSNITQRLRDDQMKGAIESFKDAQIARNEALDRLVTLQQELAVIDSKSAVASIQHQIMGLEQEIDQMEISLAIHMENARPNTSKVNALKTSIRINKDLIEAKQAELTQTTGDADSLASKNARMIVAEADYQTREMMVQAAVQSVEAARVAADRQARYLATSVAPVRPEDPSYLRKFENTLLSFLIFGGVYLIMSLTASILREQV
jgi:capsular polysaccharide transport system permease protein